MSVQGPLNTYSYSGANRNKKNNNIYLTLYNDKRPASYSMSQFTTGRPKNPFQQPYYNPNYNPYSYYYTH